MAGEQKKESLWLHSDSVVFHWRYLSNPEYLRLELGLFTLAARKLGLWRLETNL